MMPKTLSVGQLLPKSPAVTLDKINWVESGWVLEAHGPDRAPCPACLKVSHSRHSCYWRTLKDLPSHGAQVVLKLRVNRWRCGNAFCAVRFFTRPLGGVVKAYARETNRAHDLTLLIGHALGGLPGERLMSRLNMATSDDTILRRLKHLPREAVASEVRVMGVDEWAWSKGQSFGTILVDLEQGRVVDVLAESSADALAAWLRAHPGVTTISRDRHGRYAEGAHRAAPDATQVADRFHLVRNLRQAVERELAVHRRDLRVSLPSPTMPPEKPQGEKKTTPIRICSPVVEYRQKRTEQWRQEKLKLFQTIQQMKAAGMKVSEIAGHLGMNRRRIDKWVRLEEFPERSRMLPRPGMAESFREYLRERWEQGCHHGRNLLAEIQPLGYVGCYSRLAQLLSPWRQAKPESEAVNPLPPPTPQAEATAPPTVRQISPQVASALLSKPRPELSARQAEIVDILKEQCPGFAIMRKLTFGFRAILSRGKVATLHRWMEEASQTGIHPMERFVRTVKQDLRAVEAAVTEKWSNGPVEGQINRLKALKRQMYGRAGVELLRARVLPLPVLGIK
jgi:transposase